MSRRLNLFPVRRGWGPSPTFADLAALRAGLAIDRFRAEDELAAGLRRMVADAGLPLAYLAARLGVPWEHLADVITLDEPPTAELWAGVARLAAAGKAGAA